MEEFNMHFVQCRTSKLYDETFYFFPSLQVFTFHHINGIFLNVVCKNENTGNAFQ